MRFLERVQKYQVSATEASLSRSEIMELLRNTGSFANADDDLLDDLLGQGTQWEFRDVPVSSVHRQTGFHDANAMPPAGTEGPIVVNMKGVVVDGNHRHAAAEKSGEATIPAYVPVGWKGKKP